MEDYSDGILDTSLDYEAQKAPVEKKKKPKFNLQECLEIIDNIGPIPHPENEKRFADILLGLGIFDRSTFGNLEPHGFLKKLMLLMKHEVFLPRAPIIHYNQPEEKLCVIVKGKAKVFIPKTGHEMEKESLKIKIGKNTMIQKKFKTISDMSDNEPKIRSEKSLDQTKSLVNIPDEKQNQEGQEDSLGRRRARSFKKLQKAKTHAKSSAVTLPSQENLLAVSYSPMHNELRNNTLPQSLKDTDEEIKPSLNSIVDEEVDEDLMKEFRKQQRNYFVGEILKVKFSRIVGTGSHFGIRGIGKSSTSKEAVSAAEECHCITLYKDDYLMALNQEKTLHSGKIDFFRKMFPDYNEDSLVEFSLLWDKQIYKRGEIVYQENENCDSLYIVFEGEVVISKEVEDFAQARSNADRSPVGKKKDTITLQVATLCQGYFFGEEFFKKEPRLFTATISSSKAKILHISLKDYKLYGRKYFDFFAKIKEMIKLSYKLNADRLETLYQSHGVEVNRQAVHEDYLESKELLSKAEIYSRKEILKSSRKIINPITKNKNVNLRLQYDKYFVCKPGQKYPEYLKIVMQADNQSSTKTESKDKPLNQETLNNTPTNFSTKRTKSFAPQQNESPEKIYNFIKPLPLSRIDPKFNIPIPKIGDFGPIIIDTFVPSSTRTIGNNDTLLNPLGKSMALPRTCKSISKATSKKYPLRSLFTERLNHQESNPEDEDKLLDGTSEIIPMDLKNVINQDIELGNRKLNLNLNPLDFTRTPEKNRKNYNKNLRDRSLQFGESSLYMLNLKGLDNTPKVKSNRKMMLAKRVPGENTPQNQNSMTPSTFLQSEPAKLTIKLPVKPKEKTYLPHIRSKSINR